MTTQYAVLKELPNGLALDAGKLFTLASPDTVVTGNTFGFSNRTNANTQYVVSIVRETALPAGDYTFIAYIGSSPKAEIALTFLGTDGETATETARLAELDPATQTQIDNIESAVSAGSGARTVTITVNDGTTVLQNARVRLTEGSNSYTALTNVSGVVVFNVDDATYTVSITKSGYTYSGTTIVVNGTETATYSMTINTVTPPDDPALCAVTFHLRDQYGANLADQPVEITWVQWADSATETPPVLSVPPVQETNASGEVSVNLYRNAQYKIVYGEGRDARRWDGTIPDAGSYEVEL